MAKTSVFRIVRVLGALSAATWALAASSCADVSVIDTAGPAPEITSVEPASGPTEGGTPVLITGARFEKGATVRFGGRLAAKMEWVDASTLNALTPPGIGKVSVSVENPGRRVDTIEEAFTYTGGAACAVVTTTPDLGAADIPIVGELRLKYSVPLDAASLQDAVTLRHLDTGEDVPIGVTLAAETDSELLIRPKKSLRFWGSYAVLTTDAIQTLDGTACAPAALAFATVKPEALPRPLRPAQISGLVLAGDTVIAASDGYRGLQVYDVTKPESTALASDLVTSFAPYGLVALGDRAYAPAGFAGVQIFDIAEPTKPVLIGYGGTPGFAYDVAAFEKGERTFIAVAEYDDGVRLLDVTETDDVVDLGKLELGPGATLALSVRVQGDQIVVANGTRFVIVNVPDPLNLGTQELVTSFDTTRTLTDVLLDGDVLYAARSRWGLEVYDVSDPAAPALIDFEEDTDGECIPNCLDSASRLARDGDDLFVAFGRGGVVRFSVDDGGKLTPATNYVVPGAAYSLAITDAHVFAGGEEGLVVFDRHGDGAAPLWLDPDGHGVARTIGLRDGHAYVTASLRGVQTFSLAAPEAPALVDRDDTPSSLADDVAASGLSVNESNVLAIGDGRAGLTLFDITDPKNPVLGGSVDTSDGVGVVLQVGPITYVCNGNEGVIAVDTTDVNAPKEVGHAAFDDFPAPDGCNDLLASTGGDLLYVGRHRGLGVLDISDPTAIAWKALVTLPSKDAVKSVRQIGSHLVAVSARFDYEGEGYVMSRLRVFDAKDPVVPELTWSSAEDLGGSASLTIVGDVAFVSANAAGLHVFDISNIEAPVLEGTIATPGNVLFVAPATDLLYVAEGAGGVQAIRTGPLPQPTK